MAFDVNKFRQVNNAQEIYTQGENEIIFPHTIYDYTDLSLYSEKEVPYEVRTKDGKAIDFELYWEYGIAMTPGISDPK